MNGKKCGEVAIDAGIAGDHGVPTIMVSGDDKVCKEARKFIKGVQTVQVKKGWMLKAEYPYNAAYNNMAIFSSLFFLCERYALWFFS
jgi:D-aminopeptidase